MTCSDLANRPMIGGYLLFQDPQKQAIELLFSRKRDAADHPVLFFDNVPVTKVNEHKHLGIILDMRLSFSAHVKSTISRTRKGIGMLFFICQ